MTIVNYKVFGSLTDRYYYSQIVEVDTALYKTDEEIEDYINELLADQINFFDPNDWDEEGSESDCAFSIESIERD